jgi:hypothetical protein
LIDFARKKVPHEGDSAALRLENIVVAKDALVMNVYETDARKAMIKLSAPGLDESLVSFMDGKALSVTVVKGRDAMHKAFDF